MCSLSPWLCVHGLAGWRSQRGSGLGLNDARADGSWAYWVR